MSIPFLRGRDMKCTRARNCSVSCFSLRRVPDDADNEEGCKELEIDTKTMQIVLKTVIVMKINRHNDDHDSDVNDADKTETSKDINKDNDNTN